VHGSRSLQIIPDDSLQLRPPLRAPVSFEFLSRLVICHLFVIQARVWDLFDDFQVQLAQVRRIQGRRRVEHEIAGVRRLRERNDLANVGLVG
jgi:hypothetical protein